MNEDIKARWVAELRSGTYTQGIGYLHVDEKFCCLGVLCEIGVQDGVIGEPEHNDFTGVTVYDSCTIVLPENIMTWAGLDQYNPIIKLGREYLDGDAHMTLSSINDSGFTFDQIADIIEYCL